MFFELETSCFLIKVSSGAKYNNELIFKLARLKEVYHIVKIK